MSRALGRVMPARSGCHITSQTMSNLLLPSGLQPPVSTANQLDWASIRRVLTAVGQKIVCLRCTAGDIRTREVVRSTDEADVSCAGILAREVRVRVA